MRKLPGISVEVTDDCVGCGECLDKCFIGAIEMVDDHARIDDNICKACGVCVENCPSGAISIEVTDGDAMKISFFEEIEKRVDVYSHLPGKEVNTVARKKAPHPRWGHKKIKIRHSRE
jgi:Fe-S-cluster-containing hydrogenase component 2